MEERFKPLTDAQRRKEWKLVGMSFMEAGRVLGVSHTTVSRAINGKSRRVKLSLARNLATMMGVPVRRAFPDVEE